MNTKKSLMKNMIALLGLCVISLTSTLSITAQEPNEINIWPAGVGPGSEALSIEENVIVRDIQGDCIRDWAYEKITVPTLTVFQAEEPNGAAAIICPGGAYTRVVYDNEGTSIAQWLNTLGITGFVLKYRLPVDDHVNSADVPLQDAQRAMRYVKANAETYGIDTSKLIIMGASAGGHNAAMLGASFDKETYDAQDEIDAISAKPHYMVLLYPVVSMVTGVTHSGSRDNLLGDDITDEMIKEYSAEMNVSAESPSTIIFRAKDDNSVSAANGERLVDSLLAVGVPAEMHTYENGGHGRGICKAVGYDFHNWIIDCAVWLYENDLTDVETDTTTAIGQSFLNTGQLDVFPNPVSSESDIAFSLSENAHVSLALFDITGKAVFNIMNAYKSAGEYTIPFPALEVRGTYILKYSNGTKELNKKVVIN